MKIGVIFPSRFEDPGEFLADARAMEAAGVDSVWLEETNDGLDPMLILAAIAAVTTEVRLGLVRVAAPSGRGPKASGREFATLDQLSRHRLIPGSERWRRVDVPADREAWAKTLDETGDDSQGVLVPMDKRLLDILRHPHDVIDRSDLILAQG
jgi:alkanesulfonate monooxygenase SsuD/methylene tetrahydromethanopterin reductase-like flavin-dependent oxidoreductase (luciferase family)